jgi:hypothetical protein
MRALVKTGGEPVFNRWKSGFYHLNEVTVAQEEKPSVSEDFKAFALKEISKETTNEEMSFSALVDRPVLRTDLEAFRVASRMLKKSEFISYCVKLINDYHAGDSELAALLMRSTLRVGYSSTSALLHYSATGVSGGGKSDLLSSIAALLPEKRVIRFTSVTPQGLFSATQSEQAGKLVVNPLKFSGKVVIINELNDAKAWNSLKAYGEMNEYSKEIHLTTSGSSSSKELTLQGARCVLCASVNPVPDDQVRRRFIEVSVQKETEWLKAQKATLASSNTLENRSIENDPRCKTARAGFEMLLNVKGTWHVTSQEVKDRIHELSLVLSSKGLDVTRVKQFVTLCQCSAVEKRFQRGYLAITLEDVEESLASYKLLFENLR